MYNNQVFCEDEIETKKRSSRFTRRRLLALLLLLICLTVTAIILGLLFPFVICKEDEFIELDITTVESTSDLSWDTTRETLTTTTAQPYLTTSTMSTILSTSTASDGTDMSITSTDTSTITTPRQCLTPVKAFWPFDGNTLDYIGDYDGVSVGNISYTTSFSGYGSSINLDASLNQYISISSQQVFMNSTCITIEAWIYPVNLTFRDFGIFGQCERNAISSCFHFLVRNMSLYCGFYNNDVKAETILVSDRWSHVACVYNINNGEQQIWLNGRLESTRIAIPYLSSSGLTMIGTIALPSMNNRFFNGRIDQLKFETRPKNASELLDDATLCVHYSFDDGSLLDYGPNGINLTLSGTARTVTGMINTAIEFNAGSFVYVDYASFYFLGVSNYPFTLAVWIKPLLKYSLSTIWYVTAVQCFGFLTMTSDGHVMANLWNGTVVSVLGPIIPLNSWTHVGYTYSETEGIQLYINGTFHGSSEPFSYTAHESLVHVTFGSQLNENCLPHSNETFIGALDELYIYSRELNSSEIFSLTFSL